MYFWVFGVVFKYDEVVGFCYGVVVWYVLLVNYEGYGM